MSFRSPKVWVALLSAMAVTWLAVPWFRRSSPGPLASVHQREPKLTHRACVALGRVGLDLPRRYDVVCTNLSALARGQLRTPASDHDLLWARVSCS